MTQIKKLKNSQGVQVYPHTHTKAVIDDNGYTAESRLQAMQDEINQKQLEVGAIPSDLTPTKDSSNWVTSGGVYNTTHLDTLPSAIDLNNYDSVNIWRTTENWTTTYTGKFIPVKAGSYYRVTANAQNDSFCCFTLNNNGSPYLASDRVTIAANTATTLKAPFDAMFLWVSDTASSVRLPQSVEEFESTYILDKLSLFNEMPNTIDLSNYRAIDIGPTGDNNWLSMKGWYGKFIYIKGYKHIFLQAGINDALFCLLTEGGYKVAQAVSYVEGYEKNGKKIYANTWEIIDIPDDALYLYYFVTTDNYATNKEPSKVILLNELVHRDELSSIIEGTNSFPNYIKFGENEGVMYTIDNFIMKHIYDNDVEYLCFSKDLGKNWVQVENTFDAKITHAHYFIDGTLLMCTPTKCYWTKDFQTFTESTVYDYDGSIFQPTSGTRFYTIPKYKEKRTVVNNEEWHLWGDYIITTTKPRLWYTKDNGRTIHAAYAFGLSNIDGTVYNARHIHAFEYNPYDGYFYAFTGDSSTECHIIKGQYNNDTWNWEHIATGALWKLTSPVFFNGYFAAVTDYTDSSLAEKKGLVRCPTNTITEDHICYLFNATSSMMGSAALSGYIYDKNGWRVMSTDYLGGNKVLIAKNNYDFVWVGNDDGKRISSFIGPNANGDVYAKFRDVGASTSGETWLKINDDSFNFTKAMRDAGAKDFFNYRITDF